MSEFFINYGAYFWTVVFVVLVVVEVLTYNLTTIWFALSSAANIFLAWYGLAWQFQIAVFVFLSAVFLAFTRPLVFKKFKNKKNLNRLVDEKILVTKKVVGSGKGEGKTSNGVVWNVISDSGKDIAAGTNCEVTKVTGNTLTIKPVN